MWPVLPHIWIAYKGCPTHKCVAEYPSHTCDRCKQRKQSEEKAKTCLETVLDDAPGRFVTRLKKDSDYYFQMQTELFSSETKYFDFV